MIYLCHFCFEITRIYPKKIDLSIPQTKYDFVFFIFIISIIKYQSNIIL